MISLIVISLLIAVIVGLLVTLLGRVLKTLAVPIAVTVGAFFDQYGWTIGVIAGLWYFFTSGTWSHIGVHV